MLVLLVLLGLVGSAIQSDINGIKFKLDRVNSNTQVSISVMRFYEVVQHITLGEVFGTAMLIQNKTNGFTVSGNQLSVNVTVTTDTQALTIIRVTRTAQQAETRSDCVRLQSDQMSWYGGPQQRRQYWPVDKLSYDGYSYVTKEADSCAIAERYWLNSRGSFIHVDAEVPLFLDQNLRDNSLCLVARRQLPYDTHTAGTFDFSYTIGISTNAREAHMHAVDRLLGKPTGYPREEMVKYPVFSTWAKYERDVNDAVVTEFSQAILDNGYANSQFELDDDWEVCYGALEFRSSKFADIKATTDALKAKGFRVTLWIHPFINVNCTAIYKVAVDNKYLVLDHNGSPLTKWWNSDANDAAYIDFTNPAAATWFYDRLVALKTLSGVDSYKFDAGESSWTPIDPVLTGNTKLLPGLITTKYVETVAKFGDLVEVRSGLHTQNLPVFVRMIDKDTFWTYNNGLPTLITTLLQMNMNGYPLVLPDMVGGNGYDHNPPSSELFVRWLQANVFMPSIQYSFVPWDFGNETIANICKKFTDLHATYATLIMERFELAKTTGAPVNPPLWWSSPTDKTAQTISDQFMLGDTVIAAPVIQQGADTRHVYLTNGQWKDGTTGTLYVGPRWLMDYKAPLDVLPHFIKV